VVERRTSLPILSNVLLDAQGETLTITGTDLDTTFVGVYPARVSKPGKTTVPARKLYEIAKELPGEEAYLKEKENNFLHISGGRATFDLVGMAAADYPPPPEPADMPRIKIAGEVLAEMIEKTIFSISQEDTRFNLAGLYVQKRKKDDGFRLRFVSTDGHRLSLIDREMEGLASLSLDSGVIIPRKGVHELRRLAEEGGEISLGINPKMAVAAKEEVRLILRLSEGSFPDYDAVIPKSTKRKAVLNRQAFAEVLRRVSLIASERFQGLRMEFKEGLLEIVSQNPDLGEARETLEMDYAGEPFSVGFNARYFLDLGAAMRSEEIALAFVDEQNPCLIKGEGDAGFLSVIMPMRL
jgi:DNA polymerase-3 subunit beta